MDESRSLAEHIQEKDLYEIVYTPFHPEGSWVLRDLVTAKNTHYLRYFTAAVALCSRLNGRDMMVERDYLA